ncbi:MAG: radical SAM protein, partial [Prevotellaceae bacterium]|nr:radical SAM protein [Prevotellaceae bacterium]
YIFRGYTLLNNLFFPSNKKLASVMLYVTDRCNCRCRHCYIWQKQPKTDMPVQIIRGIVENKVISKHTKIGLEGGEFVLHPEYLGILKYFKENHPNFDLLSNCVEADRLINAVKCYTPQRLYVSLDGEASVHHDMRRSLGLYDKVLYVIRALKDTVPLSVMFTLTPFNSMNDMIHVAELCKTNGVDLRIGIYNEMEYFETKASAYGKNDVTSLDYEVADIPEAIREFGENYDFLLLYHHYRRKHVRLTCNSIRDSIVIYPNGDVPLCQQQQIILGNLASEPLDNIMNKKSTVVCHKQHWRCNGCWINFHRKYDIILYRNLEKIFPKKVIARLAGDYSWTKSAFATYKNLCYNAQNIKK